MKNLGLICSFIIFTQALFAQLTVTPDQFSLTPGTTTEVTFTFNCDFDGNVVPSTTASGVTFTGLIPFPAPPFAPVNNGVCSFNVVLSAGADPNFSILFTVLSAPTDPGNCVDVSDTASASFGVFPSNNDCANAITLDITQDMCIPMGYSITNATASGISPSCVIATGNYDLFYKFTANDDIVNLQLPAIPGSFGYYGIYEDDCPTGSDQEYLCKIVVGSNNTAKPLAVVPGTVYYMQLIFSPTAVGDQEVCLWSEASAPVTWLKPLTVRSVKDEAQITFSTAQQTNNSHFEIEHSRDGRDYLSIGKIEGEGDVSTETEYEYMHDSPAEGLNYYRIKQVDYDGQFSYGNIASMVYNAGKVRAYPNPVDDILTVQSSIEGSLMIYSHVWQEVGTYPLTEGQTEVDMSQLGSGIYFLKYSDGTVERIVKN